MTCQRAETQARLYKDEQVVCRSSYHFFTFGKGVNALNDKVVVVQEESEMEFLALKKIRWSHLWEFYNKFIRLKQFKKSLKNGSKFFLSERSGIDRSLTDENIFFDDSRVQYFPIRFGNQGKAKVTVKKNTQMPNTSPASSSHIYPTANGTGI